MSEVKTNTDKTVASLPRVHYSFETTIERLSLRQKVSERSQAFPHILASPIHYESNYAYPLLVWFHDVGKSEVELFDVVPKISKRNYVAVAPRGMTLVTRRVVRSRIGGRLVDAKSWTEPCNDWPETKAGVAEAENLAFDAIKRAIGKFNINHRRIFLLGRGSGATMAMRVGLQNPREFAGVISIDGAFPSLDNLLFREWSAVRELPILMTTGLGPNCTAKLTAEQLHLMHTAGMTVVVRQYNENTKIPNGSQLRMDRILADVNRWIMNRLLEPQESLPEFFDQQ
ncbi:MAG: alpha/beta hydrolase [Thermoguttaceae bacterium]